LLVYPIKKGALVFLIPSGMRDAIKIFSKKDLPKCRLELILTPPESKKGDTQKQGLDNPALEATSFL
jgi:hypothetical protein